MASPIAEPTGIEVWSTPAWREGAVDWLDRQLAAAGIERTGEIEQPHLRAWATALKAPTTRGVVWLKAAAPGTAFEVGLYELLHRVVPDRVLEPIAVDSGKGWILLPDGGRTLGDRLAEIDLIGALERIMPHYGQLQLDLAPHADEMVALGVMDMRPSVMPERFDEAVRAVGAYVERSGTNPDRSVLARVASLRSTFGGWCKTLASAPGAASIDHNDLHPWNILVSGPDLDGRARFYDWGDSVVSHPFASLLAAFVFLTRTIKADASDPRIVRVRDAYLEPFRSLAPHGELVRVLELACKVGKVARTLVWARAIATAGETMEARFHRAPLESLGSLLSASYIGGA